MHQMQLNRLWLIWEGIFKNWNTWLAIYTFGVEAWFSGGKHYLTRVIWVLGDMFTTFVLIGTMLFTIPLYFNPILVYWKIHNPYPLYAGLVCASYSVNRILYIVALQQTFQTLNYKRLNLDEETYSVYSIRCEYQHGGCGNYAITVLTLAAVHIGYSLLLLVRCY